jgi:PAS domain S-box-containing protein
MENNQAEYDAGLIGTLFEDVDFPVFITNETGKIIFSNKATAKLMGLTVAEINALRVNDFLRTLNDDAMGPIPAAGLPPLQCEILARHGKIGSVRVKASRQKIFTDANQGPFIIYKLSLINGDGRFAMNRADVEGILWDYFNIAPDIICIVNSEFQILRVNNAAIRISGYPEHELLMKSVIDFVPESYQKEALAELARLKVEGRSASPVVFEKPDGSESVVYYEASRINGDSYLVFARDITEQNHMEKKARRVEEELEMFFEQSQDGFYIAQSEMPVFCNPGVDDEQLIETLISEQVVVKCNSGLANQYGTFPEELVGKNLGFFLQHDMKKLRTAMRQALGQGFLKTELQLRKMDGTPFWVEGNYRISYDRQGRITGHYGVHRDITERRKMETEYREMAERLQLVASSANIGFWDQDFVSGTVHRNDEWAKMLGFTPDEIESRLNVFLDLLHPDDLPAVIEEIKRHESGDKGLYRIEHRMKTKSGDWKWILNVGKIVFRDDTQKPMRAVGVHIDIDELKKAEQALRLSEETYRGIINSANDAIYVQAEDGCFLDVNLAAERMYGYPRAFFIGSTPSVLSPEGMNDMQNLAELLTEAFRGRPQRFEFWGKRFDGSVFPKEVTLSPAEYFGKKCVIAVARDITRQKEEAGKLKESLAELERVNNEKDKFFSILAHDLRSPFNSFLGLTELMSTELHTMTLDEIQKIATTLQLSAANLYRLIDNLLEWSKIRRGLAVYNPEEMTLSLMVDAVLQLHTEAARRKEIGLLNAVPEGVKVCADEKMLETVLRNLISNAIKFTGRGGLVRIEADNQQPGHVVITVRDTGIGIPEALLPDLFSIQADTGRRGTGGEPTTGLGLPLCKEFVELHGGKISVISQEGKGSRFTFTMPASC